ncbi:hypothetical protein AYO22_10765 [Fonsecaea multimorphosa]|nr:hypothetical protein AYO22_10765 [Fonsecaea multimorphosa]
MVMVIAEDSAVHTEPVSEPVPLSVAVIVISSGGRVIGEGVIGAGVASIVIVITVPPPSGEVSVSTGGVYPQAGEEMLVDNGPSVGRPVAHAGIVPLCGPQLEPDIEEQEKLNGGKDQIVAVDRSVVVDIDEVLEVPDAIIPFVIEVLSADAIVILLARELVDVGAILLVVDVTLTDNELVEEVGIPLMAEIAVSFEEDEVVTSVLCSGLMLKLVGAAPGTIHDPECSVAQGGGPLVSFP